MRSNMTTFIPTTASILLLASVLFTTFAAAQTNTTSTAFEWPPSQYWDGIDGKWSSFSIRLGNPEQYARVLPATTWQETWVVLNSTSLSCSTLDYHTCSDSRGLLVDVTNSTTWNTTASTADNTTTGLFELRLDRELGYTGNGEYGSETLGLTIDDSGVTLKNQVVAAYVDEGWWNGVFGLGDQPTNYTGYNDPQPSFLTTLYRTDKIPSLSWAYTAGAKYRLKGVFGSLVFGGYDTTRFVRNNVTFTQGSDSSLPFMASLRTISANISGTAVALSNNTVSAASSLVSLDSATPYLWLDNTTCDAFVKHLGLTNKDKQGKITPYFYYANISVYNHLLATNPSFDFVLADQVSGSSNTITVTLPFSAFDVELTDLTNSSNTQQYFPIRRLPVDGTPTLGRVFFQETYLISDYHSKTFSLSQALFPNSTTAANITSIYPGSGIFPVPVVPTSTNSTPPEGKPHTMATSLIVSIVLAALIIILLVPALIYRREIIAMFVKKPEKGKQDIAEVDGTGVEIRELGCEGEKFEMYTHANRDIRAELVGSEVPIYEMDGGWHGDVEEKPEVPEKDEVRADDSSPTAAAGRFSWQSTRSKISTTYSGRRIV